MLEASQTYKFAVNSPGAPPYLYLDETTNTYVGLINDVIQEASKMYGISVEYVDSHRARNEPLIYAGKIDAFLLSKVWLSHPEKVIASTPLFSHRMFLYKVQPFEENFNLLSIENSKICTRENYVYPSLTNMSASGIIERVDSRSQISIVNMLIAGRCEYAIMNEFNAVNIMTSGDFKNYTFYTSPMPTDETHTEIILRSELSELKKQLDDTIAIMQKDGRLIASLEHHVKNKLTP
ncbi:MAG: transporter substrate-binding domain-containing protein [Paraglaciecola sp.]|uniref:substrate-binding periplasmic protein n=1 Tax=Paraglaciecola sp. TaxID=1920173 RepID=UPI003298EEC0